MKQNKIPRNEYIRKPVGKTNPYKHDVLYTNLGQWKYPGQVTRIPSNNITMQGVPYPVYGEDDLGYGQMMYPGMDYTFPGQYVTEIPMAQNGIQTESKKIDPIKKYEELLKRDAEIYKKIEEAENTTIFDKVYTGLKNKAKSDYETIKEAGEYVKGLFGGLERKWESMQEEDPRSIVNRNTSKVTTPKTLPSKKTAKSETKQPDISFGYKELDTKPDVYNPKDSLVVFTNTFDNDQGARYIIGHKIKEVTDAGAQKTFNNARAVAHFLRDSDILPNQKITPKEWTVAKGYKYKTTSPGKTVSAQGFNDPEKFRTLYKPNPANDGTYLVKYLKNKELTPEKSKDYSKEGWELDFTVSNQHKFSDVAWDEEGPSTGYLAKSKWLPLKNGKHTYIPYKNKKGFSRFSGGSVIYLFKDPKSGKSIGVDVSGSVNDIKEAGEDIINKYGIKPQDLELAYHDMGSYSAKPKAHGDKLDYSQWLDYNDYNRGFSGAPLIIPKKAYGGDPSLPNIEGHYQDGGDYNMQRALELGYKPDETEHWPSVDSETGMWLKSKKHPTAWMEYMYGQLDPELAKEYSVRVNPEGYFGDDQLQYVPKKPFGGQNTKTHTHMKEGGWLDEYQKKGEKQPIYVTDPNDSRLRAYNDSLKTYELSNIKEKLFDKNPLDPSLKKYEDQANKISKRTGIKPVTIKGSMGWSQPYNEKNLDSIEDFWMAKYKKPIQPYILKEPENSQPKKEDKETPIIYTDYNEYLKAKKSYDDSLNVRKKSDQTFLKGSKTRPLTDKEKKEWKDEKTGLVPYLVELTPGNNYYGHFKKPVVRPEYKKIEEPVKKEEPKKQAVTETPKDYHHRQQEFSGNWKIMRYFDKAGKELYRDIDYGGGKVERQKMQKGGWLDEIDEEYRRGGLYTPPKIKRKAKKYGTSKNIQSSINKLFTRNYDVFGPGGKNIYNPKAYKTGGWLDNLE